MNVGKSIRKHRQLADLTQEELATKIKKTPALVSHIEQTGKVNYYTLQAIAKVLGTTVEALQNYTIPTIPTTTVIVPPTTQYEHNTQLELKHLLIENALLKEQIVQLKLIVALQTK